MRSCTKRDPIEAQLQQLAAQIETLSKENQALRSQMSVDKADGIRIKRNEQKSAEVAAASTAGSSAEHGGQRTNILAENEYLKRIIQLQDQVREQAEQIRLLQKLALQVRSDCQTEEYRQTLKQMLGETMVNAAQPVAPVLEKPAEPDIKTLVIRDNIQKTYNGMFANEDFERVVIPDYVTEIGDGTFQGWKSLREVVFQSGSKLERVGKGSFIESGIEKITLPRSVTEISDGAFVSCENLKTISFQEGSRLEKIGMVAFGKSNMETFVAPPSLRVIAQGAFCQCPHLKRVELNEGLEVLGTDEYQDNGKAMHGVFEDSSLEEIKLPSTLKKIEYDAFRECKNLQQVELPEGLERIGNGCFYDNRFEEVTIPSSVTEICENAFNSCENLGTIIFKEGSKLEKIGLGAFNSTSLRQFIAPASLRVISQAAFCKCKLLKRVELNEGLKMLGNYNQAGEENVYGVFEESGLESVKLPSTLKKIACSAFEDCKSLKHVELPAGLEAIGKKSFNNVKVDQVTIPANVREIGNEAFKWCSNLKKVTFEGNSLLERIGEQCFAKSAVQEIAIPSNVTTIEEGAFNKCENLRFVTFMENSRLQNLGKYVFNDCDNVIIYIKSGMKYQIEEHTDSARVVRLPPLDVKIGNTTLEELRKLVVVEFPEGLEAIGEDWFASSQVERIVIPASVVEIKKNAFKNCSELKEVQFANGKLKILGEYCFCKSGIEEVEIPKSVTTIGDGVFQSCQSLETVTFQEGSQLKSIGGRCFQESALEKIVVPRSVEKIGDAAFKNCERFCQVIFEEGSLLEEIGEACFYGSGLKEVTIPNNVAEIPENAFNTCESLRVITFTEGSKLEKIGIGAFNSANLEQFTAPPMLKSISQAAFCKCPRLKRVVLNEGIEVLGTKGKEGEDKMYGVFQNSALESIKFSSTLKTIEYNAFKECKNLKSIELFEGLETIGDNCFQSTGLEEVTLPKTVKNVGDNVFSGCDDICVYAPDSCEIGQVDDSTKILPRKDIMVGDQLLADLRCLEIVHLPEGIEKIGSYWFSCSDVVSVAVPTSVREISSYAFQQCKMLKEVTFTAGSKLETIGCSVFELCEGLRHIQLPDSLRTIGDWSFRKTGLEEIVIPESATDIGDVTFARCASLKSVTLNEGLQKIGQATFSYCGIETIKVPSTVKGIQKKAFCGCENLKTVQLQEGLEKIGEESFHGCNMEQLSVPRSVKLIDDMAFYECKRLRSVTFATGSALKEIHQGAFGETQLNKDNISFPRNADVSKAVFVDIKQLLGQFLNAL